MLFEMYESYSEKQSPDTYNGLPICDRDDLMNAIEDAAGSELRKLVEKYLDKVERQVNEEMKCEKEFHSLMQLLIDNLKDINAEFGEVLAAKHLNHKKLHEVHSSYCNLWDKFGTGIFEY